MHDAFVARLKQRMAALTVGHALEPGVDIGPVIDRAQLESNMAAIASAREVARVSDASNASSTR